MARPKRKLNDAKEEVIKENILKENPEGFPDSSEYEQPIQIAKHIPKLEKIVFRNDRDPGIPLEFHYASATLPLRQYKLLHGETYELPVEIIEHLESCAIPIYAYRKGRDGHPEMFVNGMKYQFQCKTVREGTQRYAA